MSWLQVLVYVPATVIARLLLGVVFGVFISAPVNGMLIPLSLHY